MPGGGERRVTNRKVSVGLYVSVGVLGPAESIGIGLVGDWMKSTSRCLEWRDTHTQSLVRWTSVPFPKTHPTRPPIHRNRVWRGRFVRAAGEFVGLEPTPRARAPPSAPKKNPTIRRYEDFSTKCQSVAWYGK
jgi:hypothetical protein